MEDTKRPVGRPPLNPELTVDEKIIKAYQSSASSLQDIARIYNTDINHVLRLTGNDHLATVAFSGDMIDQAEAGRGATVNGDQEVDVPFSLN